MLEVGIEVFEDKIYLNEWDIEIHFWDKCFRCAKTGFDTRWFDTLQEAISYCLEN